MEKFRNLRIFSRLRSLMHSGYSTKSMSVHLAWRLVIGAAFVIAITVCLLAWFSYGWAIKTTDLPPSRRSRDVFSIDELRGIIDVYQKKENYYAALRHAQPKAPALGQGSDIGGASEF